MEQGTIFEALSFGVGRIKAAGGEMVVFTERVFNEAWERAVPGRPVLFVRYVGASEAKNVVGQ